MYHLLVSAVGWAPSRDVLSKDRIFEYTEEKLTDSFMPNGTLDEARVTRIPALFATETGGSGTQSARIGYITKIEAKRRDVSFEYHVDVNIPPIPNSFLQAKASEFGIEDYELSRTHWAIKDIDLFRVLLKSQAFSRVSPKVFNLDEFGVVEDGLISVMMPFASQFNKVYETIQKVSSKLSLKCHRADDIWNHEAIIQDVVSLINRSMIVICDCTGRNANVFYEAGIAHTLGKDVILITQNRSDVPFDLSHLRYIYYLDNNEGREQLSNELSQRIKTLVEQQKNA
jgi:hypothetical protein